MLLPLPHVGDTHSILSRHDRHDRTSTDAYNEDEAAFINNTCPLFRTLAFACFINGIYWEVVLFLRTPFAEGWDGVSYQT